MDVFVPSSLGHWVSKQVVTTSSKSYPMFQSPLHWGIAFNFGGGVTVVLETEGFSPLFIGASRSTFICFWGVRVQNGFLSPLFLVIAFNIFRLFCVFRCHRVVVPSVSGSVG